MNIPDDVAAWLHNGERGLSSESIVEYLIGIPVLERCWQRGKPWRPSDPGDLIRCQLMLESCPSLMPRLHEMADASPHWARLVEHWDDLIELLEREAPQWRQRTGSAPQTFAVMCAIERGLT